MGSPAGDGARLTEAHQVTGCALATSLPLASQSRRLASARCLSRDRDHVVQGIAGTGEEFFDIAGCLADAVLVLHQRNAHKSLAVLAKAEARGDGDVGLLHQELRELYRAHVAIGLRDRCPGEHGGRRRRHLPARPREAFHQAIATALVGGADLLNARLRAVERSGGGDLHGRECAVIEVGFHARQRPNQALVADGKTHAPAGHGVGLRQRGELHGDVKSARHLQHGGWRRALEIDLRVGEIREDDEVELLCELHHLGIEVEPDRHRRWIGGIAQHHGQRLGDRVLHCPLDAAQEGGLRIGARELLGPCARGPNDGDVADGGAGDDEAELVNGIGRARHQDHVAWRRDCLRHVGKALFGAERGYHLRLGVELYAEAAGVVGGLGLAKSWYPLGGRVAIGARFGHRLNQLVDDVLGRGHVRVAHAKIDDVGAAGPRRSLEAVDFGEDVGGQALDAMEFFDHVTNRAGLLIRGAALSASRRKAWSLAVLDLLGGLVLVGLAPVDHLIDLALLLVLAEHLFRQLGDVRQLVQRQALRAAAEESGGNGNERYNRYPTADAHVPGTLAYTGQLITTDAGRSLAYDGGGKLADSAAIDTRFGTGRCRR